MRLLSRILFGLAISVALPAQAQVTDLHISQAYARPTVIKQANAGLYVSIENKGKTPDKLISAGTPLAASVEIHTMWMEGHVMKMREVENIEIKPKTKLEMKPGEGYHLMLIGLAQPLKQGAKFPVTLVFEKAGKIELQASVDDKASKASTHGHGHPHRH